jgi:hypothetical protein
VVKFGPGRFVQTNLGFISCETQKIPDLFLTPEFSVVPGSQALQVGNRQVISEPSLSSGNNLYVLRLEPNLLMKFTKQCLFQCLVRLYTALRELPSVMPTSSGPENFILLVEQNDPHIGAVSVL